jgi:hypothetical protein
MTYKKKANKEIRDEVYDLMKEKEELRQESLKAQQDWDDYYAEQFRKDREREHNEMFPEPEPIPESEYPEDKYPMD